jgi:hypothetical protein
VRRGTSLLELIMTLAMVGVMLLLVGQLSSGYWKAYHSADRSEIYQGSLIATQIAWEVEQALSITQPANGAAGSILTFQMIDPLDPTRINPGTAVAPWNPAGNVVTRRYEVINEQLIRTEGGVSEVLGQVQGYSVDRRDPTLVVAVSVQPDQVVYPCRARALLRR